MRSDVSELRAFYDGPLGQAAGLVLAERVRRRWPALGAMQVLGLGYAPPLLDGLAGGAAHVVAAMPAGQGAARWPAEGRCRTVLTEEDALPFPDLSFDRVLLAHDVETSEHLSGRLREIWRILAAEGRLIVVAPSRRGLWARFEHTPFGHGRPWSRAQLERLLREAMFTPLGSEEALFAPPLRRLVRPGAAEAWERFGRRCLPVFGGVVIAEAAKRLAGVTPEPVRSRRRLLQGVLTPQPSGAPRCGRPPSRSAPPCGPGPIHNCGDSRSRE